METAESMHTDDVWDVDDNVVRLNEGRAARTRSRAGQGDYARARQSEPAAPSLPGLLPGLSLGDVVSLLMRELWLMLIIFIVIAGIGVLAASRMSSSYTAGASLLMQLGESYVYNSPTNDAGRGAIATIDQVVQSETAILGSTDLKKRVIDRLGYKTILPGAPKLWNPATPAEHAASEAAAIKVIQAGLSINTAPQNPVVLLSFKHSDPEAASLILNTLIDEYAVERRRVLADKTGPLLQAQRQTLDDELAQNNETYRDFLTRIGVGDFDAARATYSKVYDQIQTDLYATQTQIAQDNAKLADIKASLGRLSPEMSTERDLDLSVPNKLAALQQQRQDLLSRYLPDAPPVKDVDAQIASLQTLMTGGRGIGEQSHKLGVNPVYTDLTGQRFNLEADVAAMTAKAQRLQDQAAQVTAKLLDMQGTQTQYNTLSTERNVIQDGLKSVAQRIQENNAAQQVANSTNDSVRIVERASPPDKPQSLKRLVMIVGLLFAAISALCAGLLRVVTRRGFVSAAMASKALDLPVLAQAKVKAG